MAGFYVLVPSCGNSWVAYSGPREDSMDHECMYGQFGIQSRWNPQKQIEMDLLHMCFLFSASSFLLPLIKS